MATGTPTLPGDAPREATPHAHERAISLYAVCVAVAIGVGVLVRSFHVLRFGFPLNDGGLFFQMVRDLQANSYRLPEFTSYNQDNIPFGYPPLTMYLAAFVDDLSPFSLTTLFRLLPLLATSGTVAAMFLLARRLLPSRVAVVGAVLVFALTPRSFIWLLMGGGLTRSFGLLFAILALWQVQQLYAERDRRHLLPATLLAAATVLSHVETGYFLAFSIAIFWVTFGRHRHSLLSSAVLAGGTLVLTAPWWATVISYHGLDPFRAAQDAGGSVFTNEGTREYVRVSLARVVSTSEPWYPLLGTIGFLGAIITVLTRRYFLLAWWVATIVLDPRAYPTLATVPVSFLAGIAISELLVPLLSAGRWRRSEPPAEVNSNGSTRPTPVLERLSPAGLALAGVLFLFSFVGAFITQPGLGGEGSFLKPLSGDQRALMAWIAESTPANSTFLVVPDSTWEIDKEGEWFPVLAGRQSVVTVQGWEWMSDGGFHEQQDRYWAAYDCGFHTTQCLDQWLRRFPESAYTYVYVGQFEGVRCCGTLTRSLEQDPRYVRVYSDDGGAIWAFRPTEADDRRR